MMTSSTRISLRGTAVLVAALLAALSVSGPVDADPGVSPTDGAAGGGASSRQTAPSATRSGLHERVLSTTDGTFDPDVANQGWWADGQRNHDWNTNYIVGFGSEDGVEHRNFFTFDLSDVNQHILSARLELSTRVGRHDSLVGDPVETYGLFDVSTPPRMLNANRKPNPDVFEDLGTGVSYGAFEVDTTTRPGVLAFELDHRAIRDLNRARGSYFSVGGRLLSIDPESGEDQFLFGWTNGTQTGHLVVRLAAGPR